MSLFRFTILDGLLGCIRPGSIADLEKHSNGGLGGGPIVTALFTLIKVQNTLAMMN